MPSRYTKKTPPKHCLRYGLAFALPDTKRATLARVTNILFQNPINQARRTRRLSRGELTETIPFPVAIKDSPEQDVMLEVGLKHIGDGNILLVFRRDVPAIYDERLHGALFDLIDQHFEARLIEDDVYVGGDPHDDILAPWNSVQAVGLD